MLEGDQVVSSFSEFAAPRSRSILSIVSILRTCSAAAGGLRGDPQLEEPLKLGNLQSLQVSISSDESKFLPDQVRYHG